MRLTRRLRGKFNFTEGLISVTDPCYDSDTWCRLDNIKVIPGTYKCISYVVPKEGSGQWDAGRTMIAQICLEGHNSPQQNAKRKRLGSIGVDAGLAGFYQNKPDYTNEEWSNFCDSFYDSKGNDKGYLITEHGFCTSSGYGDGEYDVYAYECKDGIYCVEIEF